MKLWDKGTEINKFIEAFTIGKDTEMDYFLAEFDVLGSLAHIQMLESIGLLPAPELKTLTDELRVIYPPNQRGVNLSLKLEARMSIRR